MPVKRRLSAAEFDAVSTLLNISADRIQAARSAMVDGEGLQAIADRYGWKTKQSVGAAVAVVWKEVERYRESKRAELNATTLLPPGWEKVELIAPSEMVERFRAEIAEAIPHQTNKHRKAATKKR